MTAGEVAQQKAEISHRKAVALANKAQEKAQLSNPNIQHHVSPRQALVFCEAPVRRGAFCDQYCHESETVSRCATLGWSQDVCKGSRFTVEGERCVVGSRSLFRRLEVNQEEADRSLDPAFLNGLPCFSSQLENNYLAEMCSGSEASSYLRLIDLCITQL